MVKLGDHLAEQVTSPGIPVLLLHAFPLDHRMWQPQIDFLAEKGQSVIAPDYFGFGQSTLSGGKLTIENYAEQAAEYLKKNGAHRAVVVGLSMGGYVALSLLRLHPEMVAGLLLANTRATADTPEVRQRRLSSIRQISETGDCALLFKTHLNGFFSARSRSENPGLPDRCSEWMKSASPEGIICALGAMAGRPDASSLLKGLKIPVQLIAGEQDPFVSIEEMDAMARQAPGGRLTIFPDSAHLSNLEQPAEFNDILSRLISECRSL